MTLLQWMAVASVFQVLQVTSLSVPLVLDLNQDTTTVRTARQACCLFPSNSLAAHAPTVPHSIVVGQGTIAPLIEGTPQRHSLTPLRHPPPQQSSLQRLPVAPDHPRKIPGHLSRAEKICRARCLRVRRSGGNGGWPNPAKGEIVRCRRQHSQSSQDTLPVPTGACRHRVELRTAIALREEGASNCRQSTRTVEPETISPDELQPIRLGYPDGVGTGSNWRSKDATHPHEPADSTGSGSITSFGNRRTSKAKWALSPKISN